MDELSTLLGLSGKLRSKFLTFHDSLTEHERGEMLDRFIEFGGKDKLTGLWNRFYLQARYDQLDADEEACLMLVDLDNFKQVNTMCTHTGGDEFLVKFSQFLRCEFRSTDVIGRHGGDEFLILLPRTSMKKAKNIRSRLMQSLDLMVFHVDLDEGEYHHSLSATVALGKFNSKVSFVEAVTPLSQSVLKQKNNSR